VVGLADAIQVAAGDDHACALRRTGDVVCWGRAGDGQIGSGATTQADEKIPTPTAVKGVSKAVAVFTNAGRSCALIADGAVFCWGQNSLGQLGDGTKERAYAAVRVVGLD
jgi:alpha-tubulin suppressor-like RCC1 family protein